MTHDTHLHNDIVSQLTDTFSSDSRVKALWLKGSLARQDADRHSDIDVHVWLNPEDKGPFSQALPALLEGVRPLLHLHPLFDGHMLVTLLQATPQRVLALDVFLDTEKPLDLNGLQHRVLFDRAGELELSPPEAPALPMLQQELEVQIRLFWRLLAMLPSIERGELIQAMKRLTDEVEVALQICSLGRGRFRDIGENRGNALLQDEEQQVLEQVLAVSELTKSALAHRHLELAGWVAKWARTAAENLGMPYPEDLEWAVLSHVNAELHRMGLL